MHLRGLERLASVTYVAVSHFPAESNNNTESKPKSKEDVLKTNGYHKLKSHANLNRVHMYQNPAKSWEFVKEKLSPNYLPKYQEYYKRGNLFGIPQNWRNHPCNFTIQFMKLTFKHCGFTKPFESFIELICSVKLFLFVLLLFICVFA